MQPVAKKTSHDNLGVARTVYFCFKSLDVVKGLTAPSMQEEVNFISTNT